MYLYIIIPYIKQSIIHKYNAHTTYVHINSAEKYKTNHGIVCVVMLTVVATVSSPRAARISEKLAYVPETKAITPSVNVTPFASIRHLYRSDAAAAAVVADMWHSGGNMSAKKVPETAPSVDTNRLR